MQPIEAQVVPTKYSSMRMVLAPARRALRSADRPAVPAPMIATSQVTSGFRIVLEFIQVGPRSHGGGGTVSPAASFRYRINKIERTMKDLKQSEVPRRGDKIENDDGTEKAHRIDNEREKTTVPANEETEGATNALKAPPPAPEMTRGDKTGRQ